MASARRSARDKPATDSSASATDEGNINSNEPHGSQGSDDHTVKNMADALKKSTKKRRDARRSKIEKEYSVEMERLQISAIANLRSIASRNSRNQRDRLKNLKDLLIRRATIETAILRGTANLEKAFSNANQELQTVLTSRIKILNEGELAPGRG